MEFNNFNSDTNCDCFKNTFEDKTNYYAIKTMKDKLRIQDFYSYWEKGKRNEKDDCKEICSLKGVSISIMKQETKDEVIEIFKILFPLAPGYKPYLGIFKFNDSCGVVKHTPSKNNKHHFDLYKCDDFELKNIEMIEIKELQNV